MTSSYRGPTITDPELLSQAKEILRKGAADWLNPPRVLEDVNLMDMRTLTLTGQDGQEVRYQLVRFGDESSPILEANFCVLTEGSLSHIRDSRVAVCLERDTVSKLIELKRQQKQHGWQVSPEPSAFTPMSQEELNQYSLADLCEASDHQLQGWNGPPEDAELVRGYTVQDQVQLWYNGDETHWGWWVLTLAFDRTPSLDSNHPHGVTILSDQPEVVCNAGLRQQNWQSGYETMPTDVFAACLRPEDVVSVTAGDYDPGQTVTLDLSALQDQLTRSLYHQFFTEYDRERHGQYVLTLRVKGSGIESHLGYEIAEEADRLTLSAGSEADVVCLSHRSLTASQETQRLFVRSPELYRTVRNIFD